jgi:eukaryotic-like serine/threonine-protein kinase
MTLEIGSLVYNRYRIDEIIAHGGMGSIYCAYDTSLGVQVALKENLYETEDSARQFRREATLLAGLRHPNLPRVTDHFAIPGQGQYLVMDYIEGQDLRQRMASRGLVTEQDAVSIGAAVCDALQYLHTRKPPVVHRDIKPGNIKITPTGQVCLVDFGLAKEAAPGQATTTGAQALTPGYAPPEQYGQGTTPLSDLYALGATLYAAMTGKIPEDGLARAMGSAQLTPLRKHNPQISERTAQVIEKAMAVRPEERYASANDLRLALLNTPAVVSSQTSAQARPSKPLPDISSSQTVRRGAELSPATGQFPTVATPQADASRPVSAPLPLTPTPAKKPFPIWAIIAGIIVVLAAGAFVLSSRPGINAPVPSATAAPASATPAAPTIPATALPVVAQATATPQPTNTALPSPTLTPAATATTTLTPTQAATAVGGGSGLIAYVSARDNLPPQIWLIGADGSNPHQVSHVADGACQPAWSPDGKRLVFITPCSKQQEEYPGATLYLLNADGSSPEPLPSIPGGDFDPAWSPDGSQIAFTSLREGTAHIFTLLINTREVKRLTGTFSDDRRPAWSPDGKRIAFESTRLGVRQVWLMAANGDSPAEFTRLSEGAAFHPAWSADGKILFYNRESGLPWLYARQVDQTQSVESKLVDQRPAQRPRLSSDGKWLAYETWSGGVHQIVIVHSNGTNRQAVTNDNAYDFDPVWKP